MTKLPIYNIIAQIKTTIKKNQLSEKQKDEIWFILHDALAMIIKDIHRKKIHKTIITKEFVTEHLCGLGYNGNRDCCSEHWYEVTCKKCIQKRRKEDEM